MVRFPLCVAWFVVGLVGTLQAQRDEAGKAPVDLSGMLAPIRQQHKVPALGVAVLVDGKLAGLGVDGVRKVGADAAVTPDDLWHLGSCTKAMTATLLARYVEQGKLQWTTTVADGLPDLVAEMHAAAKPITVQHLLAHRSGLPGGPPRDLWQRLWGWSGTLRDARSETAKVLLHEAPASAPGERFLYSNAGYMVAGAIAERLGAAAWEDLVRTELWQPLGITTGGFGMPGAKDEVVQPFGHRQTQTGALAVFEDNPPALGPAGTAHMTLRDWAKFAALHLGMPGPDGKPLLAAASLASLRTPPAGDYALGWSVVQRGWAPGPILTHTGSNTTWFCVAWLAPDAKFGVLVTCNAGFGARACDAVAAACIQRFRPAGK
ncbi:MAG: beta-lactamase family protein [Planctomycetes bacterium]|nr:beta-lactamase family protein [Planctomycetota bacterium]